MTKAAAIRLHRYQQKQMKLLLTGQLHFNSPYLSRPQLITILSISNYPFMSEGIFITKADFNRLMKEISLIKEYVINQSVPKATLKNKWVSAKVAMELLAVKETKFKSLRNAAAIVWRYKHGNRGVEVLLKSIEDYKVKTSTDPVRKAGQ